MKNKSKMKLAWISLVVFVLALAKSSLSQMEAPAHVPVPVITAVSGHPVNISCESFGNPVTLCIWEKFNPDTTKPSTLISYQGGENTTNLPGYFLYGDLQGGVCGLHAANITRIDMSKWQCTLFSDKSVYRGIVDINVVNKPDAPKFIPDNLSSLVDGETVGTGGTPLACYSAYGLPPPKFQWFLGDETYQGELFPANTTEDAEGNTYTFQQLRNQHFTWRDSGKSIRCVISHDMLTEDDVREASLPINVKYKPRAEQNSINIYVPELGRSVTNLTYNFYANPKARIFWEVDGVRISAGFLSPDRRMEAIGLEENGRNQWRAVLRVREIKRADLKKKYVLKTENDIGKQDFEICITQNPSRQGLSCSAQAVFVHTRPPPAPRPPRPVGLPPKEDESRETEDENYSPSSENYQVRYLMDRLGQVQNQMEVLREQEARLHVQLQRMKSAKSIEVDDPMTSILTATSASAENTSRDARLLRINKSSSSPVAARNPPAASPGAFPEFGEVKVESAGIFIKGKN